MIKSGCGNQNGKNAVGYLILVLTYVLVSALLSLYCLVRRAKGELQRCRPIIWQLCRSKFWQLCRPKTWQLCRPNTLLKKAINRVFTSCKWSDRKRPYTCADILQGVANLLKQRRWTASDAKEGSAKTPKHVYIVLKTSDVIILLGENKLSPYLVNIAVCLYEHKVAHVSIYVADYLFDSVFFDGLTRGLHGQGFLMSASPGGAHEFTVSKPSPQQTPHTLHLKFANKANAHNKLIDAAEGSNITSEGGVLTGARCHPVCNKTVEGLIKAILDFSKRSFLAEKGKTLQCVCYVVFLLLTEVKQMSITHLKRVLPSLHKKVEWFATHIVECAHHFFTPLGGLYSPVGTGQSSLWGNTPSQEKGENMPRVNCAVEEVQRDNLHGSEKKEPKGDTKITLVLLNEIFKNSIVKDQQAIDTLKQLVQNNIPLYVQPVCNDIFGASFKGTQVDVVLSLRMGLADYLAYALARYRNGGGFPQNPSLEHLPHGNPPPEHLLHFLKDYLSSLFFLYNIIHPFEKDGIQPWVLSSAEVYEFFDYGVASVRQALAYYARSLQRHGC
ncbi:hypothetical protein, conserved [Plasmodium vivax]|uniref:Uncharacterized protein n=1 Tax=Plasmodium vivax (strain Salvador I) TaxID=126793 RepID=A5K5Q2_PLAVS|nr:hypothetical protein, conserved [Plasmodium vivax]EDL45237.1 hypothetical protein, conserved [Plasmodium vivax]|eukprot:XP_001614964.1 hypothetical protein [Plasmodium vivax Sal-1]